MELLKKDNPGFNRTRTADVLITPAKVQVYFSLTESARQKLCTDHVAFGAEGNRLYFIETDDPKVGYKIARNARTKTYIVAAGRSVLKWLNGRRGHYDLQYDSDKKTYYVEMKKEG